MPQFPGLDVALRPFLVFPRASVGGSSADQYFHVLPGEGAVLPSNNPPWIRGQSRVSVGEVVRVCNGQ